MAWDGAGNFGRIHDWTTDESSAINIEASRMDAEDDNFRAGIEACLTKNGENTATLFQCDNVKIDGNTISSDNTNGDINLTPNGTGTVVVGTDLDVDNININGNSIISTDTNGDINLSPNGTGTIVINTDLDVDNININGNTISSIDTNGDINLSPNGTGTVAINTDLDVDNINVNGNTISSTDTNGHINLNPDGTGEVRSGGVKIPTNESTDTLTNKDISDSSNTLSTESSYTATATGLTTSPTITVNYKIMGNVVFIETRASISGTSNSTDFTLTGAPAAIRPDANSGDNTVRVTNNGAQEAGAVVMSTTGTLTFTRITTVAFTSSGTKGITAFCASYMLSV